MKVSEVMKGLDKLIGELPEGEKLEAVKVARDFCEANWDALAEVIENDSSNL